MTPDIRFTALDVQDLEDITRVLQENQDDATGIRARKAINTLLSAKGKLYRTKRGRLAIQLPPALFTRAKAQLRIETVEGYDGTLLVSLLPALQKVAA